MTKKFNMSNDEKWIKRMLEISDEVGECISAGELLVPTIGINDFVRRQTEDSQYTHYKGSWNDLINRTTEQFVKGDFSYGYRDGVILVHMEEGEARNLFFTYTDFEMFEGMKLETVFEKVKGREHEPPQLQIRIKEPKNKCNFVDIVLYRHDVLEEDGDASTDCDWEIVSINGRLKEEAPPMDPLTITRNWKHLPGGTEMKGSTPEEVLEMLCQSIMYKHGIKDEKEVDSN